jgi:hypothetical protein
MAALFAFAGLAAHWTKGETPIDSCTIITTDANELMRPLHDRMPVILNPGDFGKWLDPTQHEPEPLQALLRPFPSEKIKTFAISTYVNNPRNQGPEWLRRAARNNKTQQRRSELETLRAEICCLFVAPPQAVQRLQMFGVADGATITSW